MVQHRVRRLPVVDGATLVGIVTLDDIAVRTGNLEVAQRMTQEVIEGALPGLLLPRARLNASPMAPPTPHQQRARDRFEGLIGLAAPVPRPDPRRRRARLADRRAARTTTFRSAPPSDALELDAPRRPRGGAARRLSTAPEPTQQILERERRWRAARRRRARSPRPGLHRLGSLDQQPGGSGSPASRPSATGRSDARRRHRAAALRRPALARLLPAADPAALPLPRRPGAQRAGQRGDGRVRLHRPGPARRCRGSSPGSRQTQVASDFIAQSSAGGDIYTLLDDLTDDSTALRRSAQSLLLPGAARA